MSLGLATTRLELYRATTTNGLGDEVDDNEGELGHYETVPATYTPWVEVGRNYARNGSFELGPQGWNGSSGAGGLSLFTENRADGGYAGPAYRRATAITPAAAGTINGSVQVAASPTVAPGDTVGMCAWFRPNKTRTIMSQIQSYIRATTTTVGAAISGPATVCPAGVWTPVPVLGIVPATADVTRYAFYSSPGDWAVDDYLDVDAQITRIGPGLTLAGLAAYYDGSTPDAELDRYSFLGATHDSTSLHEARAIDVPEHDVWIIDKPSAILATDVPASVIERRETVLDAASGERRVVTYLKVRVSDPSLDVREGDRIRDLRDGNLMTVESITRTARSLAGAATLTLEATDRMA